MLMAVNMTLMASGSMPIVMQTSLFPLRMVRHRVGEAAMSWL